MALDIILSDTIIRKVRTAKITMETKVITQVKPIGHIHEFWPLVNWVKKYVESDIYNQATIEINKAQALKLLYTMNKLTKDNCEEYLPIAYMKYDKNYWENVTSIQTILNLAITLWDKKKPDEVNRFLTFYAWW